MEHVQEVGDAQVAQVVPVVAPHHVPEGQHLQQSKVDVETFEQ